MKWIAISLSGIGGLTVLVAGIVIGLERYHLSRAGIRAQGKVVEQIREVSTPSEPIEHKQVTGTRAPPPTVVSYTPVIEFQTEQGAKVRFRSTLSSQSSTDMPVGATVDVVYSSSDPSKAQVGTPSQFLATPLFMIGIGLFFLLAAVKNLFSD